MNKSNWLIGMLLVAVVILVGALTFLLGRMTESSEQEGRSPASPVSNGSATAGSNVEVSGSTSAQGPRQNSATPNRFWENDPIVERGAPIPVAFRGEWNEDLAACGTGNNDTRLRVEANMVRFYESDGEVRTITRHNPQAITVELALSGEGQAWNDTRRMVLSRSGNDLTIDGFTRHRCP